MKSPVKTWIETHPDIVSVILAIANDPKSGREYVTRDTVYDELRNRGYAIQKRKVTYVLNNAAGKFTQYSKKRNCKNITWKRVVA